MRIERAQSPLADDIPASNSEMRDACGIFMGQMKVMLKRADMPIHMRVAAWKMFNQYSRWKDLLFVDGLNNAVIPGTNNGMESEFRGMRRVFRRQGGDRDVGRKVALHGAGVLLFQNLKNEKYVAAVYGGVACIAAAFSRERKLFRPPARISAGELKDAYECGMNLMDAGPIPETPYTGRLWNDVGAQCRT